MRTRSLFLLVLAGCTGGSMPPGMDASVDAGVPDAGKDAGVPDAGDAGPTCGPEVCDGIDNDCNGTVDLLADGGTIFGLCPLQAGTCAGARIACTSGGFPPCTAAQYGAKYEEFESLCDGVDNDCSGVVDVSQWKPIGAVDQLVRPLSVPGAWYVSSHLNAQMFDEALNPLTDAFVVGKPGHAGGAAVWFGDYIHALFGNPPGPTYLRRLNLDGTFLGGADEVPVFTGNLLIGNMAVSNDKSALAIDCTQLDRQCVVVLSTDGGTRAPPTWISDAGSRTPNTVPVGPGFVSWVAYPNLLVLVPLTPDLALGPAAILSTPGAPGNCAVAANTHAVDAGSFVIACHDPGRTVYATEDPAAPLMPIWSGDGGEVHDLAALPSYAKATLFWRHGTSVWMSQVNGLPAVEVARLPSQTDLVSASESVRGGYLLSATYEGDAGRRPYAAYACPP